MTDRMDDLDPMDKAVTNLARANVALAGIARRAFRLASRHSDNWTAEDHDDYRKIRDDLGRLGTEA